MAIEVTDKTRQLPPCPHLCGRHCLAASSVVGIPVRVSGMVCNVSCKDTWHGPYCGREITDAERGYWAARMLGYQWGRHIAKIRSRYAKPIEVWVPEVAQEVLEKFRPLLQQFGWLRAIGLTGSILSRSHAPTAKDIDVVLISKPETEAFRECLQAFESGQVLEAAPKEVAGHPVDLFTTPGGAAFFMVLNLSEDPPTLHTSTAYNVSSIDPRIRVEHNPQAEELYRVFIDSLPSPPAPTSTDSKGTEAAKPKRKRKRGPSSLVRAILMRLAFTYDENNVLTCPSGQTVANCGCGAFASKMNEWGWLGCLKNRQEIREWFASKAGQCGIKVDPSFRKLIGVAVRLELASYFTHRSQSV